MTPGVAGVVEPRILTYPDAGVALGTPGKPWLQSTLTRSGFVDAETPKSSSEGSFGGRANRSPLNCGVNRLKMMTRENSDLYTEAHAIHIEFFRGENAPETAWSETDDSATGLADIEQTLIDKRSSPSSTKTTKKRDSGKHRLYTESLAQLSDSTSSGITTTLGAADETPWSTLAVSSTAVTLDKAETAAPLSGWT